MKPKAKVVPTTTTTTTSEKDTMSSQDNENTDLSNPVTSDPSPVVSMDLVEPIPSLAEEPVKLPYTSPVRDEPTPTFAPVDLDNDYIEPESPTGIDALLYDDDDDLNNPGTHSRTSSVTSHPRSPAETPDYPPPSQPIVRDDYNPLAASKPKPESTLP